MRAALAGLLLGAGCTPLGPPEGPPVDACGAACAHARQLGCPEGDATPAGASCEDVCRKAASFGIDTGAACLRAAASCDEIARCQAR